MKRRPFYNQYTQYLETQKFFSKKCFRQKFYDFEREEDDDLV